MKMLPPLTGESSAEGMIVATIGTPAFKVRLG